MSLPTLPSLVNSLNIRSLPQRPIPAVPLCIDPLASEASNRTACLVALFHLHPLVCMPCVFRATSILLLAWVSMWHVAVSQCPASPYNFSSLQICRLVRLRGYRVVYEFLVGKHSRWSIFFLKYPPLLLVLDTADPIPCPLFRSYASLESPL
jgi:hypothetical protein